MDQLIWFEKHTNTPTEDSTFGTGYYGQINLKQTVDVQHLVVLLTLDLMDFDNNASVATGINDIGTIL